TAAQKAAAALLPAGSAPTERPPTLASTAPARLPPSPRRRRRREGLCVVSRLVNASNRSTSMTSSSLVLAPGRLRRSRRPARDRRGTITVGPTGAWGHPYMYPAGVGGGTHSIGRGRAPPSRAGRVGEAHVGGWDRGPRPSATAGSVCQRPWVT